MQIAIIRSKINKFHLPCHLGAEGIINGARTIQTLR